MAYRGYVFFVVIITILLFANLSLVPFRATALSFDYDFSVHGDLERANLLYLNDSFADGDRISLTKMTENSAGRVAYKLPVRLWDCRTGTVASFSSSFSFAIGGNHNSTRGDGMAFFIGPFPPIVPPDSSAGFLGLYSNPAHLGSPSVVAVELDTFWNPELDPPLPSNVSDHVGIDINSIHSTSYTTDLKNLSLYGTMSATITYGAASKMMAVSLQLADGSIHRVQASVDLVAAGLPQEAAIGFSAATGLYWESHQLLSWSFNSTDVADVPLTDPPCKTGLLLRICMIFQASLLALLATALLYNCMRRWIKRRRQLGISLQVAREFPYRKLSASTNNFSEQLGKGTFGEVYRGELPGQLKVAVKMLTLQLPQTRRDYANEIMTLGQLYHRNLVKLVGWCDGGGYRSRGGRLLLVYELMPKRSVDMYLHGPERLLTWPERYKIVLDVGSAIEYLHTGCPNVILHRDIKPSNVMLDDDLVAKLGDFGLVRQVEPGQSSLGGTAMIGDTAYLDPVCVSKGTVSIESDVYSFGVLLLEIATGRRPVAVQGTGGLLSNTLVDGVRESKAKGQVLGMADERLEGDFDEGQMKRVLDVGLLCVEQQREHRPRIRNAVNLLLSDLSHPVPQIVSSQQSCSNSN